MNNLKLSSEVFQRVKRKKIKLNFDGGDITSDGGLLILSELDKKLNLTKDIADVLKPFDERQPGKVEHSVQDIIRQRVYAIAAGYEDVNDHDDLRLDSLMQTAVGKDTPLGSASTVSRFENTSLRESCVQISKIIVEQFIRSFDSAPKELILDFDATDIPIHGDQENKFFHGYYDHYCFLPLYVFSEEQLLCAYLRPSNDDPARHTWAILSLLVKRLRQEWPDVKIIFRGDSGFCRWKMLRWCDKNDVKYIVGIGKNARLKSFSSRLAIKARKKYNRTGKKAKLFCDIYYAAKTWDKRRRVIAKSEHNSKGPNRRYVVTNLNGKAKELYENLYCARGNMENRIKEQQLDLFAIRTSCEKWYSNQFRILFSALAYVLFERLRALILKGTKFAKAQANTIRLKLIKIGAVIRRNTRKIYISMSEAYPYKQIFETVIKKVALLE